MTKRKLWIVPAAVVIFALGAVVDALVFGWLLMLLMGILHNDVIQAVPAISYLSAVLIIFLSSMLLAGFKAASKDR